MNTNTPQSPQQLLNLLSGIGIKANTQTHTPVMTVAESQALRGSIPGLHSKNLFLKDKKGQLWLVVAQEDRTIDLKHLRKMIGAGTLSFGKADILLEVLGVTPGSVTPFAAINDQEGRVRVVLDKALADGEHVSFHPLINTQTTTISGSDLLHFLHHIEHAPLVLDFEAQTEIS